MQHQTAINAYQQAAQKTADPRELEASILTKAANRFQVILDNWDEKQEQSEIDAALAYNKQFWTILISSVATDNHPMPYQIRNSVANLGVFVMKQTFKTMAVPTRDKIEGLIMINRELAAGLRG